MVIMSVNHCMKSPLRPITPYGVSKVAADLMGYQVFINTGLPIYRVRPFNVIGPRQSEAFFCSVIASQAAEIECGMRKPVLKVGNLDSYRDFLDVRDLVSGILLIAEKGTPGEVYNLCSGKATHVKYVVDYIISLINMDVKVESMTNADIGTDVAYQVGSYDRVKQRTAWEPKIDLNRSLKDILDYWRKRKACK